MRIVYTSFQSAPVLFSADRDDRCVSDSGREAWFPYLDEQLVAFLQQLPLNEVRACVCRSSMRH